MERKTHFNFWYFVLAFFAIMLLQQWWGQYQQVETIPYSEFQAHLRDGNVAEVSVADDYVRGKLREPPPDGRQYIFTVRVDPEGQLIGIKALGRRQFLLPAEQLPRQCQTKLA